MIGNNCWWLLLTMSRLWGFLSLKNIGLSYPITWPNCAPANWSLGKIGLVLRARPRLTNYNTDLWLAVKILVSDWSATNLWWTLCEDSWWWSWDLAPLSLCLSRTWINQLLIKWAVIGPFFYSVINCDWSPLVVVVSKTPSNIQVVHVKWRSALHYPVSDHCSYSSWRYHYSINQYIQLHNKGKYVMTSYLHWQYHWTSSPLLRNNFQSQKLCPGSTDHQEKMPRLRCSVSPAPRSSW